MANYYSTARTSYFQVKDIKKFEEELYAFNVSLEIETNGKGVCLLDKQGEGFPSKYYDEETGLDIDIEWSDFFSKHLEKNHVAVIVEAGAEKLRYVIGNASAYTWDGRSTHISLDDIYKKAIVNFGSNIKITEAIY